MFWHEDENDDAGYRVPDDVFDLLFRLRGDAVDIDHAHALAEGLRARLPPEICERIGVHGIGLATSGNGWIRSEEADAVLPLSRRSRLAIRVRREDADRVAALANGALGVGDRTFELGECTPRPLLAIATLHARAVPCDPEQEESAFLAEVAEQLAAAGIRVKKMICGKSGQIRLPEERRLFTRSVLVADLRPEESVKLQQCGIGDAGIIGCGIFVPHKGIAAVGGTPETN